MTRMPSTLIASDDLKALNAILMAIREHKDGKPVSGVNRPFTKSSLKRLALQYGKHTGVTDTAIDRVLALPLEAMLTLDK